MSGLTLGIDISLWQHDRGVTPTRYFNPHIAKEKGVYAFYISYVM